MPLTRAPSFSRHVLACGGELKNTFCLAKEGHAFLSHHIGDLENYQTLRSFREGVEHYCRLFDIQPALVAYDLHPEYLSTKYALELEEEGLPAVGVQHHHAHVASCLADNGRPVEERVIGVAMDGTGYGPDGAIWGGEFLEGSVQEGFTRRAHLAYTPLPGGQASIRQPWLAALAHLLTLYREDELLELPLEMVRQAGRHNVRLVAQLLQLGHQVHPFRHLPVEPVSVRDQDDAANEEGGRGKGRQPESTLARRLRWLSAGRPGTRTEGGGP